MKPGRKLRSFTEFNRFTQRIAYSCSLAIILAAIAAPVTRAQNLNWDGQTGALVTPFAYTSSSPARGIGLPSISFHCHDGGDVLGGFFESSVTVGFLKRFEAGYIRASSSDGTPPALSPLFEGGFNIFLAKANLLGENTRKHNYLPAISLGFVARSQVRRVGGVLSGKDTHNEEVYLVATKTITYFKFLPIVASAGFKVTNASVLGMAGNAPNW
jgi:hypothetical protein